MAISTSFSTALAGLKTHQTALDVVSNNISNASNPDYVRERGVITALPSINSTPGAIGTGAEVSVIYRITDTFLFNRYTKTSTDFQFLDTKERYLKEIATYFPDVQDDGLYKNLEDFFNAWQTFASNPNDGAVKIDLASKTQILVDSMHLLRNKLIDLTKNINDEISSKVDEANNIIKQIAEINKQITAVEANNINRANQLRDKRDALEKRLKELLDTNILKNGVKNKNAQGVSTTDYEESYQIMLGGYPLIDNGTYHELSLGNEINPSININNNSKVDITKKIKNGEIGALLELRGTEFNDSEPTNGVIGNLLQNLDALASGIIKSINSIYSYSAQEEVQTDTIYKPLAISNDLANLPLKDIQSYLSHPVQNGILTLNLYDANGNYKSDIKVNISTNDSINDVLNNINTALSNAGSSSSATLINGEIKFVDSNNNPASDVAVKDDGSTLFSALNEIEYMPLDKINTTKLPIPLENGSFDINVYNDNGDIIASRTITINMDSKDPRYSTLQGILAQINTPNIDDNNDSNSLNDVDDYYKAEFVNGELVISKKTTQNTYIGLDNDSANFGGAFGVNKFFDGTNASNIDLAKKLKDNPSLISASKTPNSGDNQVANDILNLQTKQITFYTNNSTVNATIYEFYRQTTTDLANEVNATTTKKETTQTLLTSITNEYQSISGVNIDEELLNLEKYQRGYQANAKVITTINQILDALFGIKQ
jgi:flagellar hook-associated protein 1 FlgK